MINQDVLLFQLLSCSIVYIQHDFNQSHAAQQEQQQEDARDQPRRPRGRCLRGPNAEIGDPVPRTQAGLHAHGHFLPVHCLPELQTHPRPVRSHLLLQRAHGLRHHRLRQQDCGPLSPPRLLQQLLQ